MGPLGSYIILAVKISGLLDDLAKPRFLWVTEFPLFTRADEDKVELARGRWSSTHHPFTAPMMEDAMFLWSGKVDEVKFLS